MTLAARGPPLGSLLGEWLFSAAAFGPRDDEEEYREAHPSLQETLKQLEKDFDELRRMRNELFQS